MSIELISQRTKQGKKFDNGDGSFTAVAALGVLHYESEIDSGVFDAEIDCSPVYVDSVQLDGWLVEQNGWHYALGQPGDKESDGWVGFGGRQGAHWFKFRLARVGYLHGLTRDWDDIGGAPSYDRANLSQETFTRELVPDVNVNLASVAEWADIWTTPGGGSFMARWGVKGHQLKEEIVINQAAREWIADNRPPSTPAGETFFGFVLQLDWSDISKVVCDGEEQDVDSDWSAEVPVHLRDDLNRLLAFLPVGRCYVGEGKERGGLNLRKRFWQDGGRHYLLIGARVDLLNGLPAGDLVFDPTVTPSTTASADDALAWTPATLNVLQGDQFFGDDGSTNDSGYRFILAVAAGATISAAKLTFEATASLSADTVRNEITYQDANDPGDFSGDSYADFQARTRSAALQAWDFTTNWISGLDYDTADFAAVIQALVNEAYWASGEHCVILVDDDGSDGNAHRKGASWDHPSGAAPMLTVTYTTGVPRHTDYYRRLRET